MVLWLSGSGGPEDTCPCSGITVRARVCPVPTSTSGNQVLCGLVEGLLTEEVPRRPSSCSAPKSEWCRRRDGSSPKTHRPFHPQVPTMCYHPGPALPCHLGGQEFAWHRGSTGAP